MSGLPEYAGFSWYTNNPYIFDQARLRLLGFLNRPRRAFLHKGVEWFDARVSGHQGVYLPWRKPRAYKAGYRFFLNCLGEFKSPGVSNCLSWCVHGHASMADVRWEVRRKWSFEVPPSLLFSDGTQPLASDDESSLVAVLEGDLEAVRNTAATLTSEVTALRDRLCEAESEVASLRTRLDNQLSQPLECRTRACLLDVCPDLPVESSVDSPGPRTPPAVEHAVRSHSGADMNLACLSAASVVPPALTQALALPLTVVFSGTSGGLPGLL